MSDAQMKLDPARLKQLRESRGWTQEQLADIAGLNARTVQRIEAGGNASAETGMALASALDCRLPELSGQGAAPASQPGSPPVPPPPGPAFAGKSPWLILVLLAAIVVWLQLSFGYGVGKDLAERDNRGDCRERSGTDCH
jgi:transcriptional regulator with XRE-family HTH domain